MLEWPPAPTTEGGPKDLTAQDKEGLVQTYHLSEVAAALAILKSVPAEDKTGSDDESAALSLLEKALDVLPCLPPPSGQERPSSPPEQSAGGLRGLRQTLCVAKEAVMGPAETVDCCGHSGRITRTAELEALVIRAARKSYYNYD